ncbi:MAG: hypothetical protein GXO32_05170 [Crenarchaeota archaeon]|nr:hypothetical protein [Thermoproteota archaeon]
MSSIDKLIDQVAFKLASEIKDPEITCRITDYRIKHDRHGRKMLVLYLKCLEHGTVVVSLSPMYAKEFRQRLKDLGIETIRDMLSVCYVFERVKLAKAREDYTDPYPRYLPKALTSCPKELVEE